MFILGDHEEVIKRSKQLVLNPFHGYGAEDRSILNPFMDETIKELALIDGAFIVRETVVESAAALYKPGPMRLNSRVDWAPGMPPPLPSPMRPIRWPWWFPLPARSPTSAKAGCSPSSKSRKAGPCDSGMASNEHPFRIGFFGGSFDPLHNGHLMLIAEALQSSKLDKLLLCPAFHAPLRSEKPLFPGEQRLEMLRSVCSERPELETFDHEIQQARTCYTYKTLLEVRKIYPDAQIHLLIGNDQFQKLDQWKFNRELLQSSSAGFSRGIRTMWFLLSESILCPHRDA